MRLSTENKNTLLTHIHKSIEDTANTNANHIFYSQLDQLINYPPNAGLTEKEMKALEILKGNEDLKSALRKILASTAAGVIFDLFSIIDGTTDPDTGAWTEVMLIDKTDNLSEETEFLHDNFYESYWNWKEQRRNPGWSLDNLE